MSLLKNILEKQEHLPKNRLYKDNRGEKQEKDMMMKNTLDCTVVLSKVVSGNEAIASKMVWLW